jgi:hypothetical protein
MTMYIDVASEKGVVLLDILSIILDILVNIL